MYDFYRVLIAIFFTCFFCFHSYAAFATSSNYLADPDETVVFLSEPEVYSSSVAMEIYALSDSPSLLSDNQDQFTNCVYYDVTISGTKYILLLPSAYESSLWIDGSGYLWNMSTSSIQGRLFQDSFDPLADTGMLLYMQPCLGNNFSTNHNYGSPNYIRRYYWSGNNSNYTTTYVTVHVDGTHYLFQTGDILKYVAIFLMGCCLICLWKRSGR